MANENIPTSVTQPGNLTTSFCITASRSYTICLALACPGTHKSLTCFPILNACCMATEDDTGGPFPISALPTELRYAVYRCVLLPKSRKVEVVGNLLRDYVPGRMRFRTIRDLCLLEAGKQVRAEASNLLYTEAVFTINLYPRTQQYGQEPFYGAKSFHIDPNRIVKCHLLTPSGTAP